MYPTKTPEQGSVLAITRSERQFQSLVSTPALTLDQLERWKRSVLRTEREANSAFQQSLKRRSK